jgi:ribosomal 30S subunit maturation factor RimM
MIDIQNWRDLINKPVVSGNRKELGVVSDVQS